MFPTTTNTENFFSSPRVAVCVRLVVCGRRAPVPAAGDDVQDCEGVVALHMPRHARVGSGIQSGGVSSHLHVLPSSRPPILPSSILPSLRLPVLTSSRPQPCAWAPLRAGMAAGMAAGMPTGMPTGMARVGRARAAGVSAHERGQDALLSRRRPHSRVRSFPTRPATTTTTTSPTHLPTATTNHPLLTKHNCTGSSFLDPSATFPDPVPSPRHPMCSTPRRTLPSLSSAAAPPTSTASRPACARPRTAALSTPQRAPVLASRPRPGLDATRRRTPCRPHASC